MDLDNGRRSAGAVSITGPHRCWPGRVCPYLEGEKDSDRLRAAGLIATCNVGGAGKWRAQYSEALRGRPVAVLADNDPTGLAHAEQVCADVVEQASEVRLIKLPGHPKSDVSDWLDSGHSDEDLRAIVDATPPWSASADSSASTARTGREASSAGFIWTSLADLLDQEDEPMDWVVDELLIAGGLSMPASKPKVGKSVLCRNLALAVARGQPFLGRPTRQGPVVLLCLEEKRSEVARHFRQMGATRDDSIYFAFGSAPDSALDDLGRKIEEFRPVLAIVDPLQRFAKVGDLNDHAQVTRAMEPLTQLARMSGVHILSAHHMVKGDRSGGDSVLGSTALFGAVDTLLMYRERNGVRVLSSIQRYGADLPETILTLDPDTGLVSLGVQVSAQQLVDARARVVEALADDTLSEPEIRDRMGGDNRLTSRALRALVVDGALTRDGGGKRGDPFVYRRVGVGAPATFALMPLFRAGGDNGRTG
jgi:hypothetical protein